MTPFNRLTITGYILLFLFCAAQLQAADQDSISQLKVKQVQLRVETQAIKKQIRAERTRIQLLELKIKLIKVQNEELDQRVFDEMRHYKYKSKIETETDGEA